MSLVEMTKKNDSILLHFFRKVNNFFIRFDTDEHKQKNQSDQVQKTQP